MTRAIPLNDKADEPIILASSPNATGHLLPMAQIIQHLVEKGLDVFFLGGDGVKPVIDKTGAGFIEAIGECRLDATVVIAKLLSMTPVPAKTPMLNNILFYDRTWTYLMPSWLESIRSALAQIRRRYPHREVVLLLDMWVSGIIPLKLGAELPEGFDKLPKTMGLCVVPPLWTSAEQGMLAGSPMPFDTSPASKARNQVIANLMIEGIAKPNIDSFEYTLAQCGARQPWSHIMGAYNTIAHMPWDTAYCCHDRTLQMCIPSLEYSISDFPANMRFGGTLPPKHSMNKDFVAPEWFARVRAESASTAAGKAGRRRVVIVAQGTIANDPNDLIVPTLRGLAHRDDVLVVAILGRRGATLEVETPANAIVADYFPYDPVLEHADVFVANGSYGVFGHCVSHGVPMVLGGESEDKADMGQRGAWAGFAVNLQTQRPAPEAIERALDEVLGDDKYKRRAMELKKEAEEFDALATVERELRALF
jgi:UDP:flavonoid glycosyltransferase YjiC (YdhE family)